MQELKPVDFEDSPHGVRTEEDEKPEVKNFQNQNEQDAYVSVMKLDAPNPDSSN